MRRDRARRERAAASRMNATTESTETTVRAASSGITADNRLTTGRSAVARETPLPPFSSCSKTWGPAQRCNDANTPNDDSTRAIML